MRIFFIVLFLLVSVFPVYGVTECAPISNGGSGVEWLERSPSAGYYYCGEHSGDDYGCPDHADVYGNGPRGWGIYTCYVQGPRWEYNNPNRWIADCSRDPASEERGRASFCLGTDYVYFANYVSGPSYNLKNICKIPQTDVESYMTNCESSGGLTYRCRTECYCKEDRGLGYKTDYECECIDADAHLDEINGYKVCVKGNFYACVTDADCLGGRAPVKPSHSTAWQCVNQKYKVKVCAATACEDGWHVKSGYGFCEKDETQQTVQTPKPSTPQPVTTTGTTNATTAFTKKPCTDLANMDANCKCIVAGTLERGGKCVCRDDNQEIKNGKCEWTAKYVAGLESDLDSKFNSLTATIGGFEKNVWRDENGEFNTARLASDSIAGVVLGTVGGIVTSNLVKKAQVKQGFEDIGCYIGGQSVAGFGDEFNVER